MSIYRPLQISLLTLRASLNKLRHHWLTELVTILCAAVIFAMFFYMFSDFIHHKIASLPERITGGFKWAITWTTITAFTAIAVRQKTEWRPMEHLALRLGEDRIVVRSAYWITTLVQGLCFFGIMWWLVLKFFMPLPRNQILAIQVAITTLWLVSPASSHLKQGSLLKVPRFLQTVMPKAQMMVRWRLFQILRRNPAARVALGVSGCCLLACVLLHWIGLPPFSTVFMGFATGFFICAALAIQLNGDLAFSWAERHMGISAEDVTMTYLKAGLGLSGLASIVVGISTASLLLDGDPASWVKVVVAPLLCPSIFPFLMFQIDARRPAIQLMIVFLVGLFWTTALIAHILLLPAGLILSYYGHEHQRGRYYRA